MATLTLLGTQTFDTNSGTHTVVATPAVDDVIVIVTASSGNTSTTAPTDNNSDGAGGTGRYSLINTAVKASSADTIKMWIRESKIGSASSTTFTHAPGTSSGGGLGVFKITGMSRAGLNALRQSAVQSNQSAAGTPTPVLGVAALTTNPLLGAVFNATNAATMTARASPAWTERFDVGYATPTTGLETMSINSGETGTSIAWGGTSASAFASIVAELNAAAAPSALHPVPIFGFRRQRKTRYELLTVEEVYAPALVVQSADAALAEPFKTRKTRSRKIQAIAWLMSSAASAVIVPVAAWLPRASTIVRRSATAYRVIAPTALQWQYIAPLMAAIFERPKAKVIKFERRMRLVLPLEVRPPPTGPPELYPAWAAMPPKRVSHRKRLVAASPQAVYPATPVPAIYPAWVRLNPIRVQFKRRLIVAPEHDSYPVASATSSADLVTIEPFTTARSRSRKLQSLPAQLYVSAAAPITTPAVYPSFVVTRLPAIDFKRKLIEAPRPLGVSAASPGVSQAPISAVMPRIVKRRKSRPGLFLSGSGGSVDIPAGATPAVYPSFVPPRANETEHRRKLLRLPHPLGVAAATPGTTPAIYPSFLPRRFNERRAKTTRYALRVLDAHAFPATPTTQTVYPSFLPPRALRRKALKRKALKPPALAASPLAPTLTTVLPLAKALRRRGIKRKLLVVAIAPVNPVAIGGPQSAAKFKARLMQKGRFTVQQNADDVRFEVRPVAGRRRFTVRINDR